MKNPEVSWPTGTPPSSAFCGEAERARVMGSFGLDSLAGDAELDRIVAFAAKLCEAPIALVSVVEKERQRFLAKAGINAEETPREVSFCAHAMLLGEAMVVPDATQDPRFDDNALVTGEPGIRFYAGHPLVSPEGAPLGSLCVIDTVPRPEGLSDLQREGLDVLATAVMARLGVQREKLSAESRLEESERQLWALADSIPDIAWSSDTDGRPRYFNRRWYEFTGTPLDAEPAPGSEYCHPDDYDRMREQWQVSLEKGEPFEFENRLRRHDGEYRWMISRAQPVRDEDGNVRQWFGTATDIDTLRKLSESRDLLANELSHRIKNIFAVIAGLVTLTARSQPEHKPFADKFGETIRALGRAHDYVRPTGAHGKDTLHGLLGELFAPYGTGTGGAVRISGDDCAIGNRAVTPLALIFHELATNSAKYGALGEETGHVELTVTRQDENLQLCWVERGAPEPAERREDGFGSRLIEMSAKGQLGGSFEREFRPGGLVAELVVAMSAIAPGD